MKKILCAAALYTLCTSVFTAWALNFDNGLEVKGGVKTGIEVKNVDYAGKLEGIGEANEYKPTLYFRSHDADAYNGEGWFNLGYKADNWGLTLGAWAHGNSEKWEDAIHLGDHYVWASFYDGLLKLTAGQGGGTPITTGGWINADWLSYTGIRLTWVDPLGFSIGVNLPASGIEGIEPVNYLQTVIAGAKYENKFFWIAGIFDNSLVYDDSETDTAGGLHRPRDAKPVGQKGNIGIGIGIKDFIKGEEKSKGLIAIDGMVNNLGADDIVRSGTTKSYNISPVELQAALKFGYDVTDSFYAELKGKYWTKQGPNGDDTASMAWSQFQIEPYFGYKITGFMAVELSANFAFFLDSYYLAQDITIASNKIDSGWARSFKPAFDYYSTYTIEVKPALVLGLDVSKLKVGYDGFYSRDHIENTFFIDFNWEF